ncbi:hypothetical protein OZX72_00720 [Bifidobacterium sp. ESL0769]|uniref:hypothetical protein n=1 Tax=Bifidobacterium sp. ESL0769 TaxID=2983229 RepID=UPI0023F722C8|nr:hypothetical protein [Bifidobacterium sp. ESL0769]WEV67562.1 hypothetical protein OZX72_00720 [Bifidobacterium sp. ESL0769]
MAQSQLRQKTSLRTATTLLLAVLIMLFATACGAHTQQASKPTQPKTEKIVYPAQFIHAFVFSDGIRGSRKAAKQFKDSGDFTDAYARKNGDVVVIATEKQRQKRINDYDARITQGENDFQKGGKDYKCQINEDGKTMTVWTDKHLTPDPSFGIFALVPAAYGGKYYLERHTGAWDMAITIRNCHTNQQVGQFNASQGFTLNPATFGD